MQQTCQNKQFNFKYCEGEFEITPDDISFYEKMKVPQPTFCPTCRMQRRFAFRNQNKLFKNVSSFSGKEILALIPKESSVPVVTQEEWFSDSWDPMDQGLDLDFSRPFLEQLFELHKKIPQYNLNVARMVHSEYSGNAEGLKNCYMVFNSSNSEDSLYGTGYYNSKNCLDNCDIYKTEFSAYSIWLDNCSHVFFSEECRQCVNVWFSKNCSGCIDCVGCVNLRNKSFCIENKQYSREEYFEKLKEFDFSKYSNIVAYEKKILEFWKQFPVKYIQGIRNLNSTGVYITESKNVLNSYLVSGGENLKYVQFISESKNIDSCDISVWGGGTELSYEYSGCGSGVYNSKFLVNCWPNIRDTEYSLHCRSSNHLFGCVGLQKKEYCILNKKYSKEEYTELVQKIKQHMIDMPYVDKLGRVYSYGEFFPIEFSWYGYNNTLAQELFPLTKNDIDYNKYTWFEIPQSNFDTDYNALGLPDSIENVTITILESIIQCSICPRKYKIIQEELDFLKREKLPLPRICADCRYQKRISRRLRPILFDIICMQTGCNNKIQTGYNPQEGYIVYCESCYQKEVM